MVAQSVRNLFAVEGYGARAFDGELDVARHLSLVELDHKEFLCGLCRLGKRFVGIGPEGDFVFNLYLPGVKKTPLH